MGQNPPPKKKKKSGLHILYVTFAWEVGEFFLQYLSMLGWSKGGISCYRGSA